VLACVYCIFIYTQDGETRVGAEDSYDADQMEIGKISVAPRTFYHYQGL